MKHKRALHYAEPEVWRTAANKSYGLQLDFRIYHRSKRVFDVIITTITQAERLQRKGAQGFLVSAEKSAEINKFFSV